MSEIKAKSFEFFKIFFIFLAKTLFFEKNYIFFRNFNLSTSNIIGVNETTNLLGHISRLCSVDRTWGGGKQTPFLLLTKIHEEQGSTKWAPPLGIVFRCGEL
jgi:hypothetical protein